MAFRTIEKKVVIIYQDNWVQIWNADSQKLDFIPDNSIHLVITSPPYNTGMNYTDTNDRNNMEAYFEILEKVFRECYRVLIIGGKIAVNVPSTILQATKSRVAYLSLDICLMLRRIGFLDREWITWIKMPRGELPGKSTSWGSWRSPSCPYLRDGSEFILIMDKGSHKRIDKKGRNDITTTEFLKYTTNCWYFQPSPSRKYHPAPFPEELPKRLLKLYTWEGDTILDPFLGSGTTCKVAKELKRKSIGIDISSQYCDIAKQRVQQQVLW